MYSNEHVSSSVQKNAYIPRAELIVKWLIISSNALQSGVTLQTSVVAPSHKMFCSLVRICELIKHTKMVGLKVLYSNYKG